MLSRMLAVKCVFLSLAIGISLFAQQNPTAVGSAGAQEFPVVMKQSVIAGKTPVGTKVEATLEVATLSDGVVIPRKAVFTGEITESEAKTATNPSRLTIRMDSARWKNGSAAAKVFLTAWYYPTTLDTGQNLQYGPPQQGRPWNGQGAYPNPNSPSYQPFPGRGSDDETKSVPDTAAGKISDHRVLLKDVVAVRATDGSLELVSSHGNIKLDKFTTYVLASGDLLPQK